MHRIFFIFLLLLWLPAISSRAAEPAAPDPGAIDIIADPAAVVSGA